jgi:hypothetical protein
MRFDKSKRKRAFIEAPLDSAKPLGLVIKKVIPTRHFFNAVSIWLFGPTKDPQKVLRSVLATWV